ncbi:galectin-2-like [Tenrec ecaudatus]|uniref:galectin-2-like n=1 Tax=Tenrec ecaudatus TaxID=94439 RepID=UPI003F5ADCA5
MRKVTGSQSGGLNDSEFVLPQRVSGVSSSLWATRTAPPHPAWLDPGPPNPLHFPSFSINLGQGANKLNLHFNPRFNESCIVCNSMDGSWGKEQRESHLCFSPGSEVKFTVTFEKEQFQVKLPDDHVVTFPNRLGHSHLSYMNVRGGFKVSSFKIE